MELRESSIAYYIKKILKKSDNLPPTHISILKTAFWLIFISKCFSKKGLYIFDLFCSKKFRKI